jgi:hypothetical protein
MNQLPVATATTSKPGLARGAALMMGTAYRRQHELHEPQATPPGDQKADASRQAPSGQRRPAEVSGDSAVRGGLGILRAAWAGRLGFCWPARAPFTCGHPVVFGQVGGCGGRR